MKISHAWLQAFVPHDLSPAAVGDLLSRHVVTLDALEPMRADLAAIVVARVVESERIPETKLSFNKVDDGSGTLLEVVCGAPNVAVGSLYPFARTGTVLPGGVRIEKRKIRGMTSNGMLCSARELVLGTDHDGILELQVSAAPGTPLLSAMPVGDTRLELDVLPNRPDLLSHFGFARELSALTGIAVQMPPELRGLPEVPDAVTADGSASVAGARVTVEDKQGCPRYVAAVIRGVTVGPSPEWLARRVESVGARSVNNVVDATNYILHGLGQPVHAFDLARLAQHAIVVRKARPEETLITLDAVERSLQPWMTVIADGDRATALAGVLGGRDSEITGATTDVLLEVALFAPREVRRLRRAFGLTTDASYRFERGVDGGATEWVAGLAAGLIVSVAGGRIESMIDIGGSPPSAPPIALRPARVERLLGDAVGLDEIERLLRAIGFSTEIAADRLLRVVAPSWRHDIARDVDLIEEIARLRGYDVLPDTLRPYRAGTVPDHPTYIAGRRVRDVLVAAGLSEARPMPFTTGSSAYSHTLVRVTNPLTDDEPFLRASLLDTLARRAEYNLNRHQGNIRLFEIGDAFAAAPNDLPREEVRVAALVMGDRHPQHFTQSKPPRYDEWDVKALAELVARAAFPGETISLAPGSGTVLWTVNAGASTVGEARPVTLDAPVWAAPAFGFEITLAVMPSSAPASAGAHGWARESAEQPSHFVRYTPLPTTPSADFDLALLVPNDLPAAAVEHTIRDAAGDLLESLTLFDEFRGAGVPEGKRSLGWRLTLRHPERTLRDKEIDGRRSQLLKTLESKLGVVPRTA